MRKRILIILASGFEEIEAITPIDILRRAEFEVIVASLNYNLNIKGSHGINIVADTQLDNIIDENFDAIVLPGGPGIKNLRKDARIPSLIKKFYNENKLIGAICAAPTALLDADILKDKKYTAHFSVKDELPNIEAAAVIKDKNILTSQGAGTALAFSLSLIDALENKALSDKIKKSICFD